MSTPPTMSLMTQFSLVQIMRMLNGLLSGINFISCNFARSFLFKARRKFTNFCIKYFHFIDEFLLNLQ